MTAGPVGVDPDCVFCQVVAAGNVVDSRNALTVVIEPRTPKRPGHLIFLPRQHLVDPVASPEVAASAFRYAAYWAKRAGLDVDIESRAGGPHHFTVHMLPREETS